MQTRSLGNTGIQIPHVAFGAGPVPAVMTAGSSEAQTRLVAHAISNGITWFDTAAGYGEGRSEAALGEALEEFAPPVPFHVASKVRIASQEGDIDFRPLVVRSVEESLQRLRLPGLTLLQLHNSITRNRGDQPTSVTPEDVLGPRGILEGMEEVRTRGWVRHLGLTGIGDAASLEAVMRSGHFSTIQAPLHLLNPSALLTTPAQLCDPDYGGFLRVAHELGMGIFAIRVYAAGALVGAPPSAHTKKTPFFPLELYKRDQERYRRLVHHLGSEKAVRELALRFVLSLPAITSAILGFSETSHIDEAVRIASLPPLASEEFNSIHSLWNDSSRPDVV